MKHFFLLFFGVLIICNSYSQINGVSAGDDSINTLKGQEYFPPKIIPLYFIFGTLTNYGPSFSDTAEENRYQIDRYYELEKPVMNYMIRYITSEFNESIRVDTLKKCIYSKRLFDKIAVFYDKDYNLNDSLFSSQDRICSFLLGLYYKCGRKVTDSIYRIMPYKYSYEVMMHDFLKKVDCDQIYYKYYRGRVPELGEYYFQASPLLIKYFSTLEKEMHELELLRVRYSDNYLEYREKEAKEITYFFERY